MKTSILILILSLTTLAISGCATDDPTVMSNNMFRAAELAATLDGDEEAAARLRDERQSFNRGYQQASQLMSALQQLSQN